MVKRQFQDTHWLEQMQAYQATLVNQWDLVWKPDVNTTADLPWTGNTIGDTRLVKENWFAYRYTNSWWKKLAWAGGGWTAEWWDIEWNLSDQTDLQNALNSKLESWSLKTVNNESLVWSWNIEIDWIAKSATAPANPTQWDVYYNTTDDTIYSYNGEEWTVVWGSGSEFNPNWYYPTLHSGLADNLYTSDNIIDIDVWNFRTTAGSESVPSSGTASLNNLKWAVKRTVAKSGWTITPTASDWIYVTDVNKYTYIDQVSNTSWTTLFTLTSWVWDTDPLTYWLTVELQQAEFNIENASWSDNWETFQSFVSTARGTFTLSYADSEWTLTNWTDTWNNVDPTSDLWMMDAHITDTIYVRYYDECTDWTLSVAFVAEDAWTIVVSNPVELLATWVNQYDWLTYIDNAEIDASWEIVSGSNKVVYVYAYGWVNNWYMWYSADWYIVNCGRCENLPDIWTELDQTDVNVTTTECSMPFANTGFFCVEVSDDTGLSVHPKWSGQQDTNTDAYETDTVTIPTEDTDSNALPTATIWLPAIGAIKDEINFQTDIYIQRVQTMAMDYSNLTALIYNNAWNPDFVFDYDSSYIYYYDGTTTTYDISGTWTYTANDYGTERFLDSNGDIIDIPVEANTSYGSNLVDKLRTWVVTKEEYPKVITQTQYDNLPATKNTDGIIRFIYTVE